MNSHSTKKRTNRQKSKRVSNGKRAKSAKRRINKRMTRDRSDEHNNEKNPREGLSTAYSRRTQQPMLLKRTNISSSTKHFSKEKGNVPVNTTSGSYNFATNTDKKKRIYSAKPALQDSRKFTKITNRYPNDPYASNLSPNNKIGESSYIRFSAQTAPSTDFQKSFYNPYQTMTRISDNFLNIERPNMGLIITRSTARSTESSLSNFTQIQNNKTSTQLEMLDRIREKNSIANELKSLKHVDCKKMLLNTNKQLKRMNYKLKNLISNGDSHVELIVGEPKEFELLEEISLFCKLQCKNHTAPAKFTVKRLTKGKVKSYVSTKVSVPPVFKSDRSLFTVFPENNEKVFENEAIYLMFTANSCIKIEITAEFPNEEERRRRKRDNKEENDNSKIDK